METITIPHSGKDWTISASHSSIKETELDLNIIDTNLIITLTKSSKHWRFIKSIPDIKGLIAEVFISNRDDILREDPERVVFERSF